MNQEYWHKQTVEKPLFTDLLWSQPQNKQAAGKLLIIGGSESGFSAPAEAFTVAGKAGIGTARVLLPDSLRKTIGKIFVAGEYAPSTKSGSFGSLALAEFISFSQWADGVLLAGDIGHNSETTILLDSFLDKYTRQLTLVGDAIDYANRNPGSVLNREDTSLILEFTQLQKFITAARFPRAIKSDMNLINLLEILHEFTKRFKPIIVTELNGNIIIACDGEVSTTKTDFNPITTACETATWWLQNPDKAFEALSTSLICSSPSP